MKAHMWILAVAAIVLASCTSQKQATSYRNDEVYTSSSDLAVKSPAPATNSGALVVTSPDKAKAQNPASSTLEQDLSDYSYASRIKRFNSKDTTQGYFDESYTQSSGSSDGGSSFSPNVSFSLGMGLGYGFGFGMGYNVFNDPWYGWGYPYYGYGYPYYGYGYPYYGYPYYYRPWYNPWYDPWYNYGYCGCCYYNYNTPYVGSSYFGRRSSLTSTDGTSRNSTTRNGGGNTGDAYLRNSAGGATPAGLPVTGNQGAGQVRTTTASAIPANQATYRYSRPSSNPNGNNYQRSTTGAVVRNSGGTVVTQQPTPRYVRPEVSSQAERQGTSQSYSSPVYRQPKTSSEYLAPRTQNTGANRSENGYTRQSSNGGNTVQTTRQNSGNSGNSGYSRSSSGNSTPATRTTPSYSTPTRSSGGSYQAPSRSGGSYSPPSNSGGSYSAPSRSSGSGSSGSGGGSSSGGGGRRR